MEEVILRVEKVSKQYAGGVGGVIDVSFTLGKGQIASIIGGSGSGKSTLLKSIFGTLKLDEGVVYCSEQRVKGPDEQLIPGHAAMRMVAQDFNLNIYAKVYDNVASMISNVDLKSKEAAVLNVLEKLHITHLKNKKVTELSGGEQQRVAIARALVNQVQILLLDEPFSQIDTLLKTQLRNDLKQIVRSTGLSIVLVSHDPTDGLSMADHLVILNNGRVVQQGKPAELYNSPSVIQVAKLLGQANFLSKIEAAKLGVEANANIAIYPEWMKIEGSSNADTFEVVQVNYKGNHDEVNISKGALSLHVFHLNCGEFRRGDKVNLHVIKHVEFT